jgi:glycosyltransferase involved in cell wall biosynthesis
MYKNPLISIVVISIDRKRLLENIVSLTESTRHISHEIILVCQGYSLVESNLDENFNFKCLNFSHGLGVSAARNQGIKQASGKYIAFLDDDVKVSKDFFVKVLSSFECNPKAVGIIGKIFVENNPSSNLFNKFNRSSITSLSKYQMWRLANGTSITYERRNLFFDENLGVGCYFGAFEDADYLLRMSQFGDIEYKSELIVLHPDIEASLRYDRSRMFSYARGLSGCVMKNRSFDGFVFFCLSVCKSIISFFISLARKNLSEAINHICVAGIKIWGCIPWLRV